MTTKDPVIDLIGAVAEADFHVDLGTVDLQDPDIARLAAVHEAAHEVVALINRLGDPTSLYKMLDGMATLREHNLARRTTLAKATSEVKG